MRRRLSFLGNLAAVLVATACTDDRTVTGPRVANALPLLDASAAAADPGTSFCNPQQILIPAPGSLGPPFQASPYPSPVIVSGIGSSPFKVTATVRGFLHGNWPDVELLLVGPTGVKVHLLSDVSDPSNIEGVTVTFDDDAPSFIATTSGIPWPSGSYKPTVVSPGDSFTGVPGPYGLLLSDFAGTDANGTWNLYVLDDAPGGSGRIDNGWCVTIIPLNKAPVANAGGPYTGDEGSPITFDGTSSSDPDDEPIASYAWDFGDGGTGSGPTPQHTYATSGTYTVKLVVTDDDGASDEATTSATIGDVAPTATFNAPANADEGTEATISLTSPSMSDARYAFDCGGGFEAIGQANSKTCPVGDNSEVTVKGRVIDPTIDNLFSEYSAVITVNNVAPAATFGNNGPVNEGSPIQLQLTDPHDVAADVAAGFKYAFDCGSGYGAPGPANSASCPTADNGTQEVKGKIIDKDNGETEYTASVAVTNVAPVVTTIGLPSDPVAVGTSVALSASFTDVGTGDTHVASFDLDDGRTMAGTVAESSGSGTATASATYSEAGVYVIGATVTDDDGASGQRASVLDVPSYIVVYDPTGGFVTGGGWIWSPAGAYVPNPALTGKASFGFVAKYQKGATTPSGNTEFQFKAGSLNFHSMSYEWLVVAGAKAKYKGEGTINGVGGYGFMLTAIDGDVSGTGSDAFRIKIWDLATGSVVYDNKLGEDDTSDAATTLGGGSIVIHDK